MKNNSVLKLIEEQFIKMKTTLPNGEQVYAYTEKTAKHGVNIFVLSVAMIAIYSVISIVVSILS